MRSLLTVIFVAIIVGVLGCNSGPPKPPGFPPLVPCKIQVTQGGAPLSGADVTLVPVEASGTVWPIGSQTDATGIAEMRTYGAHIGAPVGSYKVTVSKIEIETLPPKGPVSETYYVPPAQRIYELVAPTFADAKTTTLQIEIVKGTIDYSVDVGAAVRITKQQPR